MADFEEAKDMQLTLIDDPVLIRSIQQYQSGNYDQVMKNSCMIFVKRFRQVLTELVMFQHAHRERDQIAVRSLSLLHINCFLCSLYL